MRLYVKSGYQSLLVALGSVGYNGINGTFAYILIPHPLAATILLRIKCRNRFGFMSRTRKLWVQNVASRENLEIPKMRICD
ncbi:Uncharacterised protein [uncultured archaeon]|nr:Uncharacterised protein [uncultured archaeon]